MLTAGHCCNGGVDGNAVMAGDLNHLRDDGTEQVGNECSKVFGRLVEHNLVCVSVRPYEEEGAAPGLQQLHGLPRPLPHHPGRAVHLQQVRIVNSGSRPPAPAFSMCYTPSLSYVQSIPMPEFQEEFAGTGVVSGFGSTDNNAPQSDDLLWVAITLIDDEGA